MTCRLDLAIAGFAIVATTLQGCSGPAGNRDEAVAIAAIQKLGGKAEFESGAANPRVRKVYLHSTKVQDADLVLLEKLPKLQNLFVGKTQLTDAGLVHILKCPELLTLSLNSTRVTDAGIVELGSLKNLKTVNCQETQVTPAGVARLKKRLPKATVAR